MKRKYEYDIAISFADKNRNIALSIHLALQLKIPGGQYYYYPEKQEETIGRVLKDQLDEVYRNKAKYTILIVSEDYVDKSKPYVQAEIDAFIPRHLKEESQGNAYLIPIITDETSLKEVHPTLEGLTFYKWQYNPGELVLMIKKMLEENEAQQNVKNQKTIENKVVIEGNTVNNGNIVGINNGNMNNS